MVEISLCNKCKHYKGLVDGWKMVCDAFPDGIPEEIFFGRNLHKEPYHGDHGITFTDIDEE